MLKTHGIYEFYFYDSKLIVQGNTITEVFDNLPADFFKIGNTLKTKCGIYLLSNGIETDLPNVQSVEREEYYRCFFNAIQEGGLGSWKWFGNLYGDKWRFDPQKNELVLRAGVLPGCYDYLKANLAKANEKRAEAGEEKISEWCRKGGLANGGDKITSMSEERRAAVGKAMSEGRKRKREMMTEEERAAMKERYRQAALRRWANARKRKENANPSDHIDI